MTDQSIHQDEEIQCRYCPNRFIWTAGEQEYFDRHGLTHKPTRCLPCRKKKQEVLKNSPTQGRREYVK